MESTGIKKNLFIILLIINITQIINVYGNPYTSTAPITITRYLDNSNSGQQQQQQQLQQHDLDDIIINNKDDYFKVREKFLNTELQRHLGMDLQLNADEKKLNKILMKLKNDEFEIGFKNPVEFKASRHFFEVFESINESKLFKLIERMPKGSVLHAHDTAMTSIDFIINDVLNNDEYFNILWYCDNRKTNETDMEIQEIRFKFSKETPKKIEDFADWKLLNDIRKEYPIPEKFNEILYKHFSLYTKNPAIDYKDINAVWQRFAKIFLTLDGIVLYKPVFINYFFASLKEFYADNVQYIEFRGLLPVVYDLEGTKYDQEHTLAIYDSVLADFKKDHPDFIGAKIIFAPYRKVDGTTFNDYMNSIIKFKENYPKFVAGFDLVAQEDLGNPLKDYIEPLLELKKTHTDIDFFFHAGETNWNGMDTDENLIDAILLGTKRIGHGYALLKHPNVMEIIKQNNISIEVNPISNQVLKLVDDNRNHPCVHLFADNYPVVISSDDPSFWGAKPLSHDFYIAFMGFASAHSDLKLFKKLAMNSIQYSSLKGNDLYTAETKWETSWNRYVSDMLIEFSDEL